MLQKQGVDRGNFFPVSSGRFCSMCTQSSGPGRALPLRLRLTSGAEIARAENGLREERRGECGQFIENEKHNAAVLGTMKTGSEPRKANVPGENTLLFRHASECQLLWRYSEIIIAWTSGSAQYIHVHTTVQSSVSQRKILNYTVERRAFHSWLNQPNTMQLHPPNKQFHDHCYNQEQCSRSLQV